MGLSHLGVLKHGDSPLLSIRLCSFLCFMVHRAQARLHSQSGGWYFWSSDWLCRNITAGKIVVITIAVRIVKIVVIIIVVIRIVQDWR